MSGCKTNTYFYLRKAFEKKILKNPPKQKPPPKHNELPLLSGVQIYNPFSLNNKQKRNFYLKFFNPLKMKQVPRELNKIWGFE